MRWFTAVFVVALVGCTHWQTVDGRPGHFENEPDEVRVTSGGDTYQLSRIEVTDDSLSGVGFVVGSSDRTPRRRSFHRDSIDTVERAQQAGPPAAVVGALVGVSLGVLSFAAF